MDLGVNCIWFIFFIIFIALVALLFIKLYKQNSKINKLEEDYSDLKFELINAKAVSALQRL